MNRTTLRLNEVALHAHSRVGFSLPFRLDDLPAPGRVRGSLVESWIKHLRRSKRWTPLSRTTLAPLDLVTSTLAVDEEWPVVFAPFRLSEEAVRRLCPGSTVEFLTRSRGFTRRLAVHLDDVQLHVTNTGLAILHVSLTPVKACTAAELLDLAQSLRRLSGERREAPRTALAFRDDGVELPATLLEDKRLERLLEQLPEGCAGMLARDLPWAILEWAAGSDSVDQLRPARLEPSSLAPSPIRQFLVRSYVRIDGREGEPLNPDDIEDLLRRFALGESEGYAPGRVGEGENPLVLRFNNLAENDWAISSLGTCCLVRTAEEGGFFDHVLPGLLRGAYLVGMHLAMVQRAVLLEESLRTSEFAAERLRSRRGSLALRRQVIDIRESMLQFNLSMHHFVISTNPRHQALHDCYRRAYLIPELYADVKEEISELDEWLERFSRSTLEGLLAVVTLVVLPLSLLFEFFGAGFVEFSQPAITLADPRVLSAAGLLFGVTALGTMAWFGLSGFLRARRARRSLSGGRRDR